MLHKVENRWNKANLLNEDLSREWTTHHTSELTIGMGGHKGHDFRNINGFQRVHGGFGIGEDNQEGRMLLEFCDEKHICIANTWSRFADKKKITYGSGCNESAIDFCIMGKVDHRFLKNVKVTSRELQHSLMVADVDKKQINETDWKPEDEKRNVT